MKVRTEVVGALDRAIEYDVVLVVVLAQSNLVVVPQRLPACSDRRDANHGTYHNRVENAGHHVGFESLLGLELGQELGLGCKS